MKRLLALLLVMVLLCSAAMAEGAKDGLVFEISGISVYDEWAGETSDTHKWIAVSGTLTNWALEAMKLDEQLSGGMVFMGKYTFDAQAEFGMDSIEPLVQAEGALVFKVPNMVAEVGVDELEITLILQGEEQMISAEGISGTTASRSGKLEGPGFDSPEAAVEAYVEAFNRGDVWSMLSTFAIETYVDNVDALAYVNRIKAITLTLPEGIPLANDYIRDVLTLMRYSELGSMLFYQYLTYNTPEEYKGLAEGKPIRLMEEEAAMAFIEAMSDVPMTDWFGKIEMIRYLSVEELGDRVSEYYYAENNQRNLGRIATGYGCDELRDVPMLIRINGDDYLMCMQCVRYGDKWYNCTLGGNIFNLMGVNSYTGGIVPIEELW